MSTFEIKELGIRIREKRKEAGMSQEKLADYLGITKSTISKYELGLREPSFEQLFKIAEALSLGPFALIPNSMQEAFFAGYNRFLHTDRYNNAATDKEAEDAEEDAANLYFYFNELAEPDQKIAIACIRALAGYEPIDGASGANPIDLAITALCKLNEEGQQKAVERVEELTEIPKYKKAAPDEDPKP